MFRRSAEEDARSGDGSMMVTTLEDKASELENLLAQPTIDLWQLREMALSEGGLVNDSIRRRAWPALCGLNSAAFANNTAAATGSHLQGCHKRTSAPISPTTNNPHNFATTAAASSPTSGAAVQDLQQVELDVTRCTWHLLTGTQRVQRLQMEHKRHKRIARVIKKKQGRLAWCIQQTLAAANSNVTQWDRLHYYQGYHDVACIFLSTLRDAASPQAWAVEGNRNKALCLDLPSAVLLQVSKSHLMDCMQETFLPLQTSLNLTIMPLLALLDSEVHNHLADCDMAPFFALPWLLTWFAHEIRDTALVKRLFDAFVSSHPSFPIYVCIAMILHPYNRVQVLETECDFSSLHHTLSGLPKNSSIVGWKYQPGTGYVSDEEDGNSNGDEDDDSSSMVSHRSEESSLKSGDDTVDGELVLVQAGIDFHQGEGQSPTAANPMVDLISLNSNSLSAFQEEAPVPFQELLDMAVQYMHRIPPRNLLNLAKRYHGKQAVDEMLDCCGGCSGNNMMHLLDEPKSWTLSPMAPSQWWLKAQVRQMQGLPPRPHKQRLNLSSRSQSKQTRRLASSKDASKPYTETVPPAKYVTFLRQEQRNHSHTQTALLASGMALSKREQKRQVNRERVAVLFVSLLVALVAWQVSSMFAPPLPSDKLDATQPHVAHLSEPSSTEDGDYTQSTMGSEPVEADMNDEL